MLNVILLDVFTRVPIYEVVISPDSLLIAIYLQVKSTFDNKQYPFSNCYSGLMIGSDIIIFILKDLLIAQLKS